MRTCESVLQVIVLSLQQQHQHHVFPSRYIILIIHDLINLCKSGPLLLRGHSPRPLPLPLSSTESPSHPPHPHSSLTSGFFWLKVSYLV